METESATQTQTSEIHERVSAQFGAAASAYSTSLVHSDPSALGRIIELADPKPADLALDIATGAGHTALALAPHVAEVVAYDVTEAMLAETGRNAASRGLKTSRRDWAEQSHYPFPTHPLTSSQCAWRHTILLTCVAQSGRWHVRRSLVGE